MSVDCMYMNIWKWEKEMCFTHMCNKNLLLMYTASIKPWVLGYLHSAKRIYWMSGFFKNMCIFHLLFVFCVKSVKCFSFEVLVICVALQSPNVIFLNTVMEKTDRSVTKLNSSKLSPNARYNRFIIKESLTRVSLKETNKLISQNILTNS